MHKSFDVGNQVLGAVTRGLVYESEHRLFAHVSTPLVLLISVVVIAGIWFWQKRSKG